jgi:hypothetical protein
VSEVLNVSSLGAFEAGDFCLEEVVARALFGVLGFESVDVRGLRSELGLEYFALAPTRRGSRCQFPFGCFELGFEVRGICLRRRSHRWAMGVPTFAVTMPVGAARGAEPLTSSRRLEGVTALFTIFAVHVCSSAKRSPAT